ncbi:hypothetical protein E5T98_22315 [Vibrio vulnificus]|nr:hypothetical protein [Vibrio vulnificus]
MFAVISAIRLSPANTDTCSASECSNGLRIKRSVSKTCCIIPPNSPNARLRGWQRITTKPKHNNCNHRGSLGLETPRVDSPS